MPNNWKAWILCATTCAWMAKIPQMTLKISILRKVVSLSYLVLFSRLFTKGCNRSVVAVGSWTERVTTTANLTQTCCLRMCVVWNKTGLTTFWRRFRLFLSINWVFTKSDTQALTITGFEEELLLDIKSKHSMLLNHQFYFVLFFFINPV